MRAARCVCLTCCFLFSFACQSAHPTDTAQKPLNSKGVAPQSQSSSDFQGLKTTADIAKLAWVNKRCRLWAADGDIDIDQTCLVVRTVRGGLVVIPNEYTDSEMKEIIGELGRKSRDKWIQRFYNIGGGEKFLR